jgi:hypothetical protein
MNPSHPPSARVLERAEEERWDAFVRERPDALVYHTTAWRDALAAAFPHIRGQFVAVTDSASGVIRGGLPLSTVRSPLLGCRLVSVPFAPISTPLVDDSDTLTAILTLARELKRRAGARHIEVRLRGEAPALTGGDWYLSSAYVHHLIRLDRPPAELLASFSRTSVQQEIRRAAKRGVHVSVEDSDAAWEDFHCLFAETRRRLSLPLIPRRFFDSLRQHLRHHCLLLVARRDGAVAGALVVMDFGRVASAEFIGDRRFEDGGSPAHALYWFAIQQACERGRAEFSFGRTARSNEELVRFKQRWGTVEEQLHTLSDHPAKAVKSRETSLAYRLARMTLRHIPVPAYRALGSLMYRHMG